MYFEDFTSNSQFLSLLPSLPNSLPLILSLDLILISYNK